MNVDVMYTVDKGYLVDNLIMIKGCLLYKSSSNNYCQTSRVLINMDKQK